MSSVPTKSPGKAIDKWGILIERLGGGTASPVAPGCCRIIGQIGRAGWWKPPAHDHVMNLH